VVDKRKIISGLFLLAFLAGILPAKAINDSQDLEVDYFMEYTTDSGDFGSSLLPINQTFSIGTQPSTETQDIENQLTQVQVSRIQQALANQTDPKEETPNTLGWNNYSANTNEEFMVPATQSSIFTVEGNITTSDYYDTILEYTDFQTVSYSTEWETSEDSFTLDYDLENSAKIYEGSPSQNYDGEGWFLETSVTDWEVVFRYYYPTGYWLRGDEFYGNLYTYIEPRIPDYIHDEMELYSIGSFSEDSITYGSVGARTLVDTIDISDWEREQYNKLDYAFTDPDHFLLHYPNDLLSEMLNLPDDEAVTNPPFVRGYWDKVDTIGPGALYVQTPEEETLDLSFPVDLGLCPGAYLEIEYQTYNHDGEITLSAGNYEVTLNEAGESDNTDRTATLDFGHNFTLSSIDIEAAMPGGYYAKSLEIESIKVFLPVISDIRVNSLLTEHESAFYWENLTLHLDRFEDMGTHYEFEFIGSSDDFTHWAGTNDLIVHEQEPEIAFWLEITQAYTIWFNFTYSYSVWKTPTQVELEINGEEVIDTGRNSGFVTFSEYQSSLEITGNLDVYLQFNLTNTMALTQTPQVITKTYLYDSFTLSAPGSMNLYRVETSGIEGTLHLYINGEDLGAVTQTNTDIDLTVGSSTIIEIVLSEKVYVPIIPISFSLGEGTYSYLGLGAFNNLTYIGITENSDLGISVPTGFAITQANLSFSNLIYTQAYSSDPTNDTSELWHENNLDADPQEMFSDNFAQIDHQNATVSDTFSLNASYPGPFSLNEYTLNELVHSDENYYPNSHTLSNGTASNSWTLTQTSDDQRYEVTCYESTDTGHYQGYLNFRNETSDANPTGGGWTFNQPSGDFSLHSWVIDSAHGRNKILEIEDYTGDTVTADYDIIDSDETVEFWLCSDSTLSSTDYAYVRIQDSAGQDSLRVIMNDDVDEIRLRYYDGGYSTVKIDDLTDGEWFHILIDYNSTGYRVVYNFQDTYYGDMDPSATGNDVFRVYSGYGNTGIFYVDSIDFSWADGYYLNRNAFLDNSSALDVSFQIWGDLIEPEDTFYNYTVTYEIQSNVSVSVNAQARRYDGVYVTQDTNAVLSESTYSYFIDDEDFLYESGTHDVFVKFHIENATNANSYELGIDWIQVNYQFLDDTGDPPGIELDDYEPSYFVSDTNKSITFTVTGEIDEVSGVYLWDNYTAVNQTLDTYIGYGESETFVFNFNYPFALNLSIVITAVDDWSGERIRVIEMHNVSIFNPPEIPTILAVFESEVYVNQTNDITIHVGSSEWEIAGVWVYDNVSMVNSSLGNETQTYHYYYSQVFAHTYQVVIHVRDSYNQTRTLTIDHLAVIYNETRPSVFVNYDVENLVPEAEVGISVFSSLVVEVKGWNNLTGTNSTLGTGPGTYSYSVFSTGKKAFSVRIFVIDGYGFVQNVSLEGLVFDKHNATMDFLSLAKHYYQGDSVDGSTTIGETRNWFAPNGTLIETSNSTIYTNTSFELGWYKLKVEFNSTTFLNLSRVMSFEVLPVPYGVNSTDVNMTVGLEPVINNEIQLTDPTSLDIQTADTVTFDLQVSIHANCTGTHAYLDLIDFEWTFNQSDSFYRFTMQEFTFIGIPTNFTHYYYNGEVSEAYSQVGTNVSITDPMTTWTNGDQFEAKFAILQENFVRYQLTPDPTTDDPDVEFYTYAETNRSYSYYYWDTQGANLTDIEIYHHASMVNTTPFVNASDRFYFVKQANSGDLFTIYEDIVPNWDLETTWIENNGTYTRIEFDYSADFAITNVSTTIDLGTTLNENWTLSNPWVSVSQNNLSYSLTLGNLTFSEGVSTLIIEGYSSVPYAEIVTYSNSPNAIFLDRDFNLTAYLSYPRYSETYRVVTDPDWEVYNLRYGSQTYGSQTITNSIVEFDTIGLDPSVSSSYIEFSTQPFNNVSIEFVGNEIRIFIDSNFNLTGTYFLYFWGESETHTISTDNETVSSLTDRGNDEYAIPDDYLFFLYDVTEGQQWIVIQIRYVSPLEMLSTAIILFIVAGSLVAIYYTQKRYNWFEKLADKIPEKWKDKFKSEDEAVTSVSITSDSKGRIIVKPIKT